MGESKKFAMTYDFEVYTVQGELKEVRPKTVYYDTIEDLIKGYREKKNALFAGAWPYNKNFRIYQVMFQEMDINLIDAML